MKRLVLGFLLFATAALSADVPTPSKFLGFEVGADRKLADYRQIVSYLRAVAAASPRVKIESLGKTTLGEDMIMAIISSEANMRNLERIREISTRLADPRGLADAEPLCGARQPVLDDDVRGARGVAIYCGDNSECEIEDNVVTGTRPDDETGDLTRAGVAIEAHYDAHATLRDNTVVRSPGGVQAFSGSTIRHRR
jgi:hypothetical protein